MFKITPHQSLGQMYRHEDREELSWTLSVFPGAMSDIDRKLEKHSNYTDWCTHLFVGEIIKIKRLCTHFFCLHLRLRRLLKWKDVQDNYIAKI